MRVTGFPPTLSRASGHAIRTLLPTEQHVAMVLRRKLAPGNTLDGSSFPPLISSSRSSTGVMSLAATNGPVNDCPPSLDFTYWMLDSMVVRLTQAITSVPSSSVHRVGEKLDLMSSGNRCSPAAVGPTPDHVAPSDIRANLSKLPILRSCTSSQAA